MTPERQIQQSDKEKIQHLQEQLGQEKKSHEEKIQYLEENYKLVPECSTVHLSILCLNWLYRSRIEALQHEVDQLRSEFIMEFACNYVSKQ